VKKENDNSTAILKGFLFFTASFIFGYCLTVLFHEFGHALIHNIFGLSNFTVFYHPFGISAVVSQDNISLLPTVQVFLTYLMGPLFDIICSTLIALPMWRARKQKYLPFMMWNGLSFLGQGIGIMMDALDYDSSWGRQTDGGMIISLTGISPNLLLGIAIFSILIGCVLLSLILPFVGISKEDPLVKIILIFVPGMAFYFSLTTIHASLFDISRLGEKQGQLIFATLLTFILSLLYKPLYPLYQKIYSLSPKPVINRNLLLTSSIMGGVMLVMWLISETSFALIACSLTGIITISSIIFWKFGMESSG
jgi:hypothetical protein